MADHGTYWARVKDGACVDCGGDLDRAGRRCAVCAEIAANRARAYYQAHAAERRAYTLRRYYQRKAAA
jgi:predicted amidophosphoribosyltransferase